MSSFGPGITKSLPVLAQLTATKPSAPSMRVERNSQGTDRPGDEAKKTLFYTTSKGILERPFRNPPATSGLGPLTELTAGTVEQLEDKSWKLPFESKAINQAQETVTCDKGYIELNPSRVPQYVILETEKGVKLETPKKVRINLPSN